MNTAEAARLAELASYDVLDTPAAPAFDALVAAAARITGCPTALISLLDTHRQWFKARCGLALSETARELAFCEYVLRTDEPLVVPDATLDARFADNPLVTGDLGLRFYAGFPLRTPSGAVLGSLCVLDGVPRPAGLTEDQTTLLTLLAGQAMTLLELRRAVAVRDEALSDRSASEQRYRALADAATDIVSRHAADGTTLQVSPSVERVLGYAPADEVGRSAPDRVHVEDQPQMLAAVTTALAGEASTVVVRSRHALGHWRTLEIVLSPIRGADGTVVELHSVSRDVTDRETADRELRLSEEHLRVLFDASALAQVEMSPDGTVTRANQAMAEVAGVRGPEVLVGHPASWMTTAPGRAAQTAAFDTARSAPGSVVHTERVIVRPDGTQVELDGTLIAVPGADGRLRLLIGTATDVTERNAASRRLQQLAGELDRARQEVAEQNALLSAVLDTVEVGIVACDAQGRLTLFNRATRTFHGVGADASLDPQEWADRYALFDEDGQTPLRPDQVPLSRALREGQVDDVHVVIAPLGTVPRLVRCSGRTLRDGAGAVLGAVVVMADVTTARSAARALAEQAEFTQVLLESSHTSMWACDADARPTYVNQAARRLLGWPLDTSLEALLATGELSVRQESVRACRPDGHEVEEVDMPLRRALREGEVRGIELVLSSAGRPARTLLVEASAIHDADGQVRGAVATGYDITDLRQSEQRFRVAFRDGPTPTARLDGSGTVQEVNAAFRRFLSVRSRSVLGTGLVALAHLQDRPVLSAALAGPGTGTEPVEVRFLRSDGSEVWCELACSRSTGSEGEPLVLAQLLDVHGRKAQESLLERAATTDGLTGLPNRAYLLQALDDALAAAPDRVGLLYVDLDGFKVVNDTYGHDVGDAALRHAATQLIACVRPGDVVARLGGDEFAVLCRLSSGGGTAALRALATRLEQALAVPVADADHCLRVAGSIGLAVAAAGVDAASLLNHADQDMYRRKRERLGAAVPASRAPSGRGPRGPSGAGGAV